MDEILAATLEALSDYGDGWEIAAPTARSFLPTEARDVESASAGSPTSELYEAKQTGRHSPGRQNTDVLLQALRERDPDLGPHLHDVGDLAAAVGVRFGLATRS